MPLTKPTGAMLNAGSTSAPQALGTATAGTSQSYSRADHVHSMPSAGDVGAIPTSQLASLATTAQVAAITPASIGAIPTSAQSGFATLTGGHLTTSQIPALGGDITLAAGAVSAQVVALQGSAVAATTPASGQVLAWNGTQWAPATASTGGGGGANGLTYYLNQGTAADAPTTNIPATPHQLGRTGETGQTTVTTGTLTKNTWVLVAGFVSESSPVDPASTIIPAGLWDFNVWAYGNANAQAGTSIRALAYIYNGTTLTLLGTSGGQVINDTSAQYSLSVLVQQTTVSLTDRIYIAIEAYATGNNHNVTAQFGDGTPSHVHTSLPLVGGTGLWKNSSGVLQSPASLLVDADVDAAAGIALSKIAGAASTAQVAAITPASIGAMATSERATYATTASVAAITAASLGALSTAQAVTLAQGGTGATSQQGALNALAGAVTANCVLKGNGTNVTLAALTSADIPTLNQNTTGTAANVTGVVTIASGGTGSTSQAGALTNLGAQAALTTAAPLAIDKGGTGAATVADASKALNSNQLVTVRATGNLQLTTAGTITGGVWTSGSAVITFTSTTATLVRGMSLSAGNTAGVIKSVDSATQITMSTTASTSSSGTITVYNSTTTTLATSNTTVIDGKTLAVNDVVFLSQTALAQNGPWIVSALGTGVTLTRPTWFTGNLLAPMTFLVTAGTFLIGGTVSISLNSASPTQEIGIESLAIAIVAQRGNSNAVIGSNSFSGIQTFAANSSTGAAPFKFGGSGTGLNTTPIAHQVEWDGTQMYVSNTAAERLPVATSKAQINNQTGTTYSIVLADAGYLVTLSNASAISVTIPTDVSVAFPIGTQILLMQLLAGQITVSAVTPGTTTVAGKNGLKTSGRYAVISLIKIAANSWIVAGDASA